MVSRPFCLVSKWNFRILTASTPALIGPEGNHTETHLHYSSEQPVKFTKLLPVSLVHLVLGRCTTAIFNCMRVLFISGKLLPKLKQWRVVSLFLYCTQSKLLCPNFVTVYVLLRLTNGGAKSDLAILGRGCVKAWGQAVAAEF